MASERCSIRRESESTCEANVFAADRVDDAALDSGGVGVVFGVSRVDDNGVAAGTAAAAAASPSITTTSSQKKAKTRDPLRDIP